MDPNAQKKAPETPLWGKCFPVAHSLSLTVLAQIGATDLLYQAPDEALQPDIPTDEAVDATSDAVTVPASYRPASC